MQDLLNKHEAARDAQLCGDMVTTKAAYSDIARDFLNAAACEGDWMQRQIFCVQAGVAYYEAGVYPSAISVLKNIDITVLDKKWTGIWKNKLHHSQLRTTSRWENDKVREINNAVAKKNHQRVLFLLSDCPYLLDQVMMTELRAVACEGLGKHELAKSFLEDAQALSSKPKPPRNSRY